jgi:hypothetical protein
LIFFTDENFIARVGQMLRIFDEAHQIILFSERFPKGTPDTEWIARIGDWDVKPVIMGGDGRILRNEAERRVLVEVGCTFVFLSPGWTNTPIHEYAWKLLKYWPKIVIEAEKCTRQAVVEVTINGKIRKYSVFQ